MIDSDELPNPSHVALGVMIFASLAVLTVGGLGFALGYRIRDDELYDKAYELNLKKIERLEAELERLNNG